VRGGAGIKPTVLEDPPERFFPDTGKRPDALYDAAELDTFIQRGLLCRVQHPRDPIPGGVFLYAHQGFITTGEGSLDLLEDVASFEHDKPLDIFFSYMPLRWAKDRLKKWGETLLEDADQQVRGGNFRRALDSAERAGYAVLPEPPRHRRDHDFNRRVFVCLYAAYKGLGLDIQAVLADARIDFSDEGVQKICLRAEDVLKRGKIWASSARRIAPRSRFVNGIADSSAP
jgi:hypothetical protein